MTDTVVDLRHHNADYGFDGSSARSLARGKPVAAAVAGTTSASILATTALFVRTTCVGKFAVWAEILDDLGLRGDETLLDLGCSCGAVLLAAAKLLPRGRAIGVDLWRADQTDNSPQNTLANAALENVADRVEVHTADITNLPFDNDSVDVIVSSLVIHNIPGRAGREIFVSEAARVLRPVALSWLTSGQPADTSVSYANSAGPTWPAAASDRACGGDQDWARIWSPRQSLARPLCRTCSHRRRHSNSCTAATASAYLPQATARSRRSRVREYGTAGTD